MRHEHNQKIRKPVIGILLLVAVLSMGIGGVAAYLSTQTGPVTNTFTAATGTQPTIVETMENNVKSNVSVNVGDPGYAVYVRAAVVITWQDDAGNVLAQVPVAGTDYTITMNETDWFQHGGFWYCKQMVQSPDETTDGISPALIITCQPLVAKGNYRLNVEIIAQTIQALGRTDDGDIPAVQDAWGVYVDANNELSATAPQGNS